MKKLLLAGICFLTLSSGFAQNNKQLYSFAGRMTTILNSLDSVMRKNPGMTGLLADRYRFVNDKVRNREVVIRYNKSASYTLAEASGIYLSSDTSKIGLIVGDFLLDLYDLHPAVAMELLIYQYQHIYDFYKNPKLYRIGLSNSIEETYFNVDGLALAGMFLKNYYQESPVSSPFEKYVINDLNDHMQGMTMLFFRTDLNLLHKMNNLVNSEQTLDEALREFNAIGRSLIEYKKLDSSQNEWTNYCNLISLRTYVFYSKQILFDIAKTKGEEVDPATFQLEDYSMNNQTIQDIRSVVKENERYFKVGERIIDQYNNSFDIERH